MFLKICDSEIHGHFQQRFKRSLPNFHKNLYKKRKGGREGGKERERETDRQGFTDLHTSMSCLYHPQDRCEDLSFAGWDPHG